MIVRLTLTGECSLTTIDVRRVAEFVGNAPVIVDVASRERVDAAFVGELRAFLNALRGVISAPLAMSSALSSCAFASRAARDDFHALITHEIGEHCPP